LRLFVEHLVSTVEDVIEMVPSVVLCLNCLFLAPVIFHTVASFNVDVLAVGVEIHRGHDRPILVGVKLGVEVLPVGDFDVGQRLEEGDGVFVKRRSLVPICFTK
jgi:hypothetical protein